MSRAGVKHRLRHAWRPFAFGLLVLTFGCSDQQEAAPPSAATEPRDYTRSLAAPPTQSRQAPQMSLRPASEWGIDFVHETGAAGKKLMPETMGPGCALYDHDGDGDLDALFTDGRAWNSDASRPLARLYRNDGGRFAEITDDTGLDAVSGYGMGVAVADYDADGDPDLALTTIEGVHLLRNDAGRYVEVTAETGLALAQHEWATTPAWLDVDGDGRLDLFVAEYVQWSAETDVFTTLDGTHKSYATPLVYEGLDNRLFRNLGGGRFADVSATSGMASGENKALGVVVLDVNGDRLPDLLVSNDAVANKLYVNDGAGGFSDEAMLAGVGYDEMGQARAGMGVDAVLSEQGAPVFGIGNFSNEAVSLYERTGAELVFIDAAQRRGLAAGTLPRLTFGVRFADFDNDGRDDLLLGNGHIEPEIQSVQNAVSHAQPVDLYLAQANGRFASWAKLTGKPLGEPVVARCIAVGDLDGDLDLDALITVNGGAPLILENGAGGERSILIDLQDESTDNRAGLGATVTLTGQGWSASATVRARGSYLGHSPYTLHFGIPEAAGATLHVRVAWPGGGKQPAGVVKTGGHYQIRRGGEATAYNPG